MFFSKTKRIENITDSNVIITEIYNKGGKTFQLFCDAVKSGGTIGENNNYCLKLLTNNGFSIIIDNRQMSIPNINMELTQEEILESINDGFKKFKEFADIL